MGRRPVKINRAALGEILKSAGVRDHLRNVAEPIAASLRTEPRLLKLGARVQLEDFETDRAVVQVVVEHAEAHAFEARYHMIRDAALAAGLRVDEEEL